jgi:micrococcal nuclease
MIMILSLKSLLIPILLIFLILSGEVSADINGKVVSVADGDTITVLQGKKQYRIRLYGIDCPEKRQAFGNKARKYTSDVVFGKSVSVVEKDKDRYGRTVGIVYQGSECLNESLIRTGYAWVYQQYCKKCDAWNRLERSARKSRVGLWQDKSPVSPWAFRKGKRAGKKKHSGKSVMAGIVYHGNVKSKVFHKAGCKYFDCSNCMAVFQNRVEAVGAGFRSCKICKP